MQVCTSLQTDNHASTPPLSFFTGRIPFLPANQQHQSTEGSSHTHTHPFNGSFSGTTQVSRYKKGKTNLDFTEARDSEWQWHQLGHMQASTLLQTDNHASTPPLRLDIQNYGCSSNLLCYHGVVEKNCISSLQSHGKALKKECYYYNFYYYSMHAMQANNAA